MDGLFILLALFLIFGPISFAIAAYKRAGVSKEEALHALDRVSILERKVLTLTKDLEQLQRTTTSPAPEPEPEAPASEPVPPFAPTAPEEAPTPEAAVEPHIPPLPPSLPIPPIPASEPRAASPGWEPVPPGLPQAPQRPPRPAPAPRPAINWEQFLGAKLIAWVGGLALFLGLAFFVKYALDMGWIPYVVRVAIGFVVGTGLLLGGMRLKQKAVEVTAHTLCATGVLVLYACAFACRVSYQAQPPLLGVIPTLLLMTLITTVAFALAVRLDAQVVAVLGMLGGFLTPIMLSTGQDNPGGLFGYIALLDCGLLAVVSFRRWSYLVPLGATGTAIMILGWADRFFTRNAYYLPEKIWIPILVLTGFLALFVGAVVLAKRRGDSPQQYAMSSLSALGLAAVGFLFAFFFLNFEQLGHRPWILFGFAFLVDLAILATVWLDPDPRRAHAMPAGGLVVFLLLAAWVQKWMTPDLLNPALALILFFTVLHSAVPLAFQRLRGIHAPGWWSQAFPVMALLLAMGPMLQGTALSFLIWPFILLVDVVAVVLAVLSATLLPILLVLVLTLAVTGLSVTHIGESLTGLPTALTMIGLFAVFFMLASLWSIRKLRGLPAPSLPVALPAGVDLTSLLPACSAALPFLLLVMISARLPILNPSSIFGLALLLNVLLLGVTRLLRVPALPLVGLLATVALETSWHGLHFQTGAAAVPLGWYVLFYALFTIHPFAFRKDYQGQTLPWITAALAGPLHFTLVHRLIHSAYPNPMMGLVPAAFVIPTLIGLVVLVRKVPGEILARNTQLAWFGGVALFFITLIFPVQFDRQWITLGWALEGAALCWLFGRIPHRGLPMVGVGLLLAAFARLALNPAVLHYHERSAFPILNWYLYTYGLVALALFAAARLLAPPRNIVLGTNVQPILNGLGTILAFLLVNIEIADFFTPAGAPVVTLQFSGNLARDMSYSIAWAVFALAMLIMGIRMRQAPVRFAGMGLLLLTLLKLFLHDLSNLGQFYRIGALIIVAVIALLSAFLYQRFLAIDSTPKDDPAPPPDPLP